MDDYYGFASFFSKIGYKQAHDPRELTVFNSGDGELRHPVSGQNVLPRFLGDQGPDLKQGDDVRQTLAELADVEKKRRVRS